MRFFLVPSLLLLAVLSLSLSAWAMEAEEALRRAEEQLKEDVEAQMKAGYRTSKGKKVTETSRAMGARNALFSRAVKLMAAEEGGREKDYAKAVAEALNSRSGASSAQDRKTKKKRRPAGFRKTHPVDSINLVEDMCDPAVECDDMDDMYRRIDGRCNNLDNPTWGATDIPFRRMAHPRYQDCYGEPFGGSNWMEMAEGREMDCPPPGTYSFELALPESLPNARYVSYMIHSDMDNNSVVASHMLTQMGQFLDHDVTLTPESEFDADDCCTDSDQENCFPIELPADDPFYSGVGQTCMHFGRSEQFCAGESDIREQFNGITSFVDASNVYGSDEERNDELRTGMDGLMKVDTVGDNDLLPILPKDGDEMTMVRKAGDVRALEMPGLASMHTLFLREHNRIAAELLALDGGLNDEEIYQRARRAVIAQMQKIVYHDYLPAVLGKKAAKMAGFVAERTIYYSDTDPTITNEFATAAYRFGHSMIQGQIQMWAESADMELETNSLRDLFFSVAKYEQDSGAGMDRILAGLINQASQRNDQFLTEEVTEHLFADGAAFGMDLAARNIQRGRDHGLPGYNDVRKSCGLEPVCSWRSPPDCIPDMELWDALYRVYAPAHPGDMDLFTAGLAEHPVEGGVVGETFACVITSQFQRLMDGDRFFFSHPAEGEGDGTSNGLSDAQKSSVLKRGLRDIICENTNVEKVAKDVFMNPTGDDEGDNPVRACYKPNGKKNFATLDVEEF